MGTPSVDLGTKTNSYCVSLLEVAGITLPSPARAPIIKNNVLLKLRTDLLKWEICSQSQVIFLAQSLKKGIITQFIMFPSMIGDNPLIIR